MSKTIQKAYQFRFYPQDDLKIILAKTFGCVRFVYNQTLDFSEKHYSQKEILESQGLKYKNLKGNNSCLNLFNLNNIKDINHAVGTTVSACGGNVRQMASKKISSAKPKAVSKETGIPRL